MRDLKVRAVARTSSWLPLGVAGGACALIVAWPKHDPGVTPLQATAILLTGALGFALDDPAAGILAASPTSLLYRRLLRLLVLVPPATLLWGICVALNGTDGFEETRTVLTMFVGLTALTIAVAGIACRRRARAGHLVAPTVLILLFLSTVFPPRWRPLPMGDIPGGLGQVAIRWSVAAAVGAVVFLVSSRDPAARYANAVPGASADS
jgi:hypothetical protein